MRCRFFFMKLDQKTCRADAKLSRPDHDVISRESFSHLWWLRSGAGDQMLIEVSHKHLSSIVSSKVPTLGSQKRDLFAVFIFVFWTPE